MQTATAAQGQTIKTAALQNKRYVKEKAHKQAEVVSTVSLVVEITLMQSGSNQGGSIKLCATAILSWMQVVCEIYFAVLSGENPLTTQW